MNAAYIDTSFLLSIIFEDRNYEQSVDCWNGLDAMFSSVLLEIESRINIYKHYHSSKKDRAWHQGKEKQLQELLENINRKTIDNEVVLEIKNYDKRMNEIGGVIGLKLL